MILLTLSPEIYVKSPRTRRRFMRALAGNLRAGLAAEAPGARLVERWDRIDIEGGDPEAAAGVASRTFGIQEVRITRELPSSSLDELVGLVAEAAVERVRERTFAVRVKKRTPQPWSTREAESRIGAALYEASAGVDLDRPQVTVRLEVFEGVAHLVDGRMAGPDGLPVGTQGPGLALVSGGFDSAVAAWMALRRGSPVDYLHFKLDCAQSDHALAVIQQLHRRWGHGTRPTAHVLDFQPIEEALREHVDPRLRQVVLKQLMLQAADRLASRLGIPALVTGESVGQVSSQTVEHLAAIDRGVERSTVLRPLAAMSKQEIIDWARRIGTHDLSARAREVCDLSEGPVAVAARPSRLRAAGAALPAGLVEGALAARQVVAVDEWAPGVPLAPAAGSWSGVPAGRP